MGKKNRRNFRQKQSTGAQVRRERGSLSSSFTVGTAWKWPEQQRVWHFLEMYQRQCERLYQGQELIQDERTNVAQVVGNVVFPAVTTEVCQRPYVQLSTSLTPNQRRLVHQACAEIGLFHTSKGTKDNRIVYISAYEDGLQNDDDHEDDTKTTDPPRFLYSYRPWFCRQANESASSQGDPKSDDSRSVETPPQLALIDQLIDQPGECLRETLDEIDFLQCDTIDLSKIPPPSSPPTEKNKGNNNNHDCSATSCLFIDSFEKLTQCQKELMTYRPTEIAFDLEVHNVSRYTQLTCLIQLATNTGKTYIIDTLAGDSVWENVGDVLRPFFADPTIVKVGHSIGGLDVRCLHRDFGIFVVNAFDTYEAARVLGKKFVAHGLANLCRYYHMQDPERYEDLKVQYQNCDWRCRPLTTDMILYARYDVHFLLALRRLLMRDLVRYNLWDKSVAEKRVEDELIGQALHATLDSFRQWEEEEDYGEDTKYDSKTTLAIGLPTSQATTSSEEITVDANTKVEEDDNPSLVSVGTLRLQPDLMRVISLSQQRCRNLWKNSREGIVNHPLRIHYAQQARRKGLHWTVKNEALLEKLLHWRDDTARQLECLPGFVVPLELLFPIALHQPTTDAELRRIAIDLPDVLAKEVDCRRSLYEVIRNFVQASRGERGIAYYIKQSLSTTSNHRTVGMKHADIKGMVLPRQRKEWQREQRTQWTALLAVGTTLAAITLLVSSTRRRQ
jgi:ribonuclease D